MINENVCDSIWEEYCRTHEERFELEVDELIKLAYARGHEDGVKLGGSKVDGRRA